MAKYLLRAVKQVHVLELTGKEKVVDAMSEAQLHVEGMKFLNEEFPGQVDVELEIKKAGALTPVTETPEPPPTTGGKRETSYKNSPF